MILECHFSKVNFSKIFFRRYISGNVFFVILGVLFSKINFSKIPGYVVILGVSLFKNKLFEDTGNVCVFVILGVSLLRDKLFKDTGICCDPGGVTSQR